VIEIEAEVQVGEAAKLGDLSGDDALLRGADDARRVGGAHAAPAQHRRHGHAPPLQLVGHAHLPFSQSSTPLEFKIKVLQEAKLELKMNTTCKPRPLHFQEPIK